MASNRLPDKLDLLLALAEDMCDGLHDYEVAVEVKQNTEAVLRPALTATRNAETTYGQCKVLKKTANAAVNAADGAGKTFIVNAQKRLSKFFGEAASTEWEAAGWPPGTVAMPSSQGARFDLIASLRSHFTQYPAHESADMEATAALADAAHTAISAARATLGTKITESGQAKAARDVAEKNLRKRMNGLIDELEVLLGPDDPMWHSFGLNRPADEDIPEPPSFTTAAPGVPGSVVLDWDDPLRAEHYRVWQLIVGTDADYVAVATVYDSDATRDGLPSGSTVKFRVTSVNAAGESQPGPVVEIVVP